MFASGFVCLVLEILCSVSVPRTNCISMFLCNDTEVAGFCFETDVFNLPMASRHQQAPASACFYNHGRMGVRLQCIRHDLTPHFFQLSWTVTIIMVTALIFNFEANVQFLLTTIDYSKVPNL